MSRTEMSNPLLQMRNINKTFPGVRALDNVHLEVHAGEIHSLMGENGAGKSTLMKILSGAYQADAGGEIVVDGNAVTIDGPQDAKALGIAVIYQELSLAPNLRRRREHLRGPRAAPWREAFRPRRSGRHGTRLRRGTQAPRRKLRPRNDRRHVVDRRATTRRDRARRPYSGTDLVMDEPTTPLSSRETDRLFHLIRQLRAEGLAIIYISHRMAEIYELSDRVSVLRDGAYVGTLMRDALSADSLVKRWSGAIYRASTRRNTHPTIRATSY
ncbi:ATP-binding cassette domain-containing protein [Trinickia sp. NRRL B-1857]|uniref:ATP-binding cassette domain-containing protein n=1 Tax=Trinickia sp. NRRL B-1857 TaxID=3162879 RepID=UPI003D2E03CD